MNDDNCFNRFLIGLINRIMICTMGILKCRICVFEIKSLIVSNWRFNEGREFIQKRLSDIYLF